MSLLDSIKIEPDIKLSLNVTKKEEPTSKIDPSDIAYIDDYYEEVNTLTTNTVNTIMENLKNGTLTKTTCELLIEEHNRDIFTITDNELNNTQRDIIQKTGGYLENYITRHSWSREVI